QVRPGLAPISRFVYAITVGHIETHAGLAHPGIDHVRIRLRDGDGANRSRLEVAVGDVVPVGSSIIGLPYSSGAPPEVDDCRVDRISGHSHHSPPTRRTDAPPLDSVEELGIFVEYGLGHVGTSPTVSDRISYRLHSDTARRLFSHRVLDVATA